MSAHSLRLPESLHRKLSEVAAREEVSINQEKMSALMTEEYLNARAQRASRRKFSAVLSRVPAVPPLPGDELPKAIVKARRKKTG
jgi:hypothetical protein